jgi:2'-5' RNA ligase
VTNIIRRQLTLFVNQKEAETIEQIRQRFNPRQFELIKAHVTLCREDEIHDIDRVVANLSRLTQANIVIEFGKVARFDNGKGLLLPATIGNFEFQELRKAILIGLIDNPRKQEPHITLMHPRNSTCTDNIFLEIERQSLPTRLEFGTISLIEQENGGKWRVLQEFEFKGGANRPILYCTKSVLVSGKL